MAQARKECEDIGRWIEQQNPKTYSQLHLPVLSLAESMTENVRTMVLVLVGAVGLVLLIAVVNVANLALARATVREREMALRLSLGANRERLIRQLLTESVLLSAIGGTLGLVLAAGAIQLLRAFNPGNLPRIAEIRLDGVALIFVLAVSLLTGVLFGLYPALQGARAGLNSTLKESGRSGGTRRQRGRSALVIAEIALSLMLLVGAGLLLRSFQRLQQVDAGFHESPQQILFMTLSPAASRYADENTGINLYTRLLQRIERVPGLDSVSISDSIPPRQEADADTFTILGQVVRTDTENPIVSVGIVSSDYFKTIGAPLLAGRSFDAHDTSSSPPVAIVSENFARRFFPGESPLGKRIKQSAPSLNGTPFMEIVGVVGDLKYSGLERQDDAAYYMPYTQSYSRQTFLVVRSSRNVADFVPVLRREVHATDPEIVISTVSTLQEEVAGAVARPRFDAWLLGSFAGIALLMAVIGIYGVIAYSVAQRTHEIGVRMALGAGRGSVVAMVLGQGARLALIGVALGLAGAFALTRLLGNLLYGISVTDSFTFITVALGLFVVAIAASLIPAQRATRILPVIALRQN
jgi:putative ABC transport system permease protein